MKTGLLLLSCFLICVCFACSAHKGAYEELQNRETDMIKEFTDPAQAIRVGTGEKFVITLDSNATTGYSWQAPQRTSVVSLNSHRYETLQSSLAGAGGREHFEFTARSAGRENLVFHYLRQWEKDVPPVKTVTFTVEVIGTINKKH
jgi:predicted secreted protein